MIADVYVECTKIAPDLSPCYSVRLEYDYSEHASLASFNVLIGIAFTEAEAWEIAERFANELSICDKVRFE